MTPDALKAWAEAYRAARADDSPYEAAVIWWQATDAEQDRYISTQVAANVAPSPESTKCPT